MAAVFLAWLYITRALVASILSPTEKSRSVPRSYSPPTIASMSAHASDHLSHSTIAVERRSPSTERSTACESPTTEPRGD
jgi:hypothetical protein